MVKTFKNFYIINDTAEPWSQAEMKYLLWRTASLNMKLSSFDVLCIPDTLPPDSVCLLFGEKVTGKYLDGKLKSIRGSVYPYPEGVMIPTYHPRDLATLRRTTENGDFQGSSIWGMDFKKAIRIFEHGYQPLVEDFNIYPTMSDVMSFIDEILAKDLLVAVDLETTGRDSSIDIFMIGLAISETKALCIPIYRQGGDVYWSSTEYPTIWMYVNKLFSNARQVYQNALFDVRVLLQRQIKVNLNKVEHDTMLLHHTISPALPHDLGFITSVYGQTPAWKDVLKESHYSIKGLSDVDARTYNLRDCCVLHQILPPMIEDAKEMDVYQTYLEEPMGSIPAALEQMSTGIYVDPEAVKVWSKEIKTRLRDSEAKLRVMGNLPESFNLMSQDHLRWFLFQEPLPSFETLSARLADYEPEPKQAVRCQDCNRKTWVSSVLDFLCLKCGSMTCVPQDEHTFKARRKTGTKAHLALLAEQELLNLKPLYPLKFYSKLTKSQKQATDADARLSLEVALSKRISEIDNMTRSTRVHAEEKKGFQKILEWIREYDRFSKAHKYSSTYTEFPVWPDGCIHPNVLLHGTETGRPASRGPNMLNQP